MAILESDVLFTGRLGDLTAYKVKGTNKIILRRKGGASKKAIKTSASFENTRRNNAEFAGRSVMTGKIRHAMGHLHALADHSYTGKLNALVKKIQDKDGTSPWGQRAIRISTYPNLLEGFSLNIVATLTSIVRAPFECAISRDEGRVTIKAPELVPGINFFPGPYHPLSNIALVVGLLPDLVSTSFGYQPMNEFVDVNPVSLETPWSVNSEKREGTTLTASLNEKFFQKHTSIVVTLGIQFGTMTGSGQVQKAKNAGAATIRLAESF
jgi:hypothetical protein